MVYNPQITLNYAAQNNIYIYIFTIRESDKNGLFTYKKKVGLILMNKK